MFKFTVDVLFNLICTNLHTFPDRNLSIAFVFIFLSLHKSENTEKKYIFTTFLEIQSGKYYMNKPVKTY